MNDEIIGYLQDISRNIGIVQTKQEEIEKRLIDVEKTINNSKFIRMIEGLYNNMESLERVIRVMGKDYGCVKMSGVELLELILHNYAEKQDIKKNVHTNIYSKIAIEAMRFIFIAVVFFAIYKIKG